VTAKPGDEGSIPLDALRRFLDEHGLGAGPLQIKRIGDGHSNLTYLVQRAGQSFVLRRPPPPPLLPGTHDIMREVRVLSRLQGVPAPKILARTADPAVIGAPFYMMEYIEGCVLTDTLPAALSPPSQRRRIGEELIDALVALHAADVEAVGLGAFGRPQGFLERQLARGRRMWETVRTRDLPAFDAVARWLYANLPESRSASIVHGDYRLGNVMFARDAPARLIAIFDWEMATLGDPLVDVGWFAAFWVQPDDPPLKMFELANVLRLGGFGTREALVGRYEEAAGRSTAGIRFYEVLALWRLAAMMEGNYRRASIGSVDNAYLRGFGNGAVELTERAAQLAGIQP
jgi:aminoglycoside phosphotransferase (APT) family kinase protein